ncbi:hypothetical protein WJX74_001713 [Apatococcus lobatus]|uniref:Uncharacterized protein n=1 Tax=Apatococcus lobatus TaxID=904363 RepID=A0AAW1SA04_9CHLO
MAFAAGAMLGEACLHQLPQAFQDPSPYAQHHQHQHHHGDHGHQGSGLLIFFGVLIFFLIESTVHRFLATSQPHDPSKGSAGPIPGHATDQTVSIPSLPSLSHNDIARRRQRSQSSPTSACNTPKAFPSKLSAISRLSMSIRQHWPHWLALPRGTHPMAYLNLLADGVHNFTDGIALSSAFLSGGHTAGWRRTLIVVVHELPQEIGDFGILVSSGLTPRQALSWNLASAGTAVVGAACVPLANAWLHSSSGAGMMQGSWLCGLEALLAGGFLWIAIGDVLPVLAGKPHLLRNISCTLAGLVFCLLAEKVAH